MNKLKLTFLMLLFFTIGATAQQYNPPIKGVGTVVKRNPGSGASKINGLTNEKGETTVEIAEKGNYIITVLQPTTTGTAMTETNGGPVKGVKMGLGKNPSGKLIATTTTNDKGEAEFKDLEPGSYTIKVQAATKDCPPGWYNLNGTCIPNEPRNPNTTTKDYIGHVTLLRYSQWYFGGGLQVPSSTTKTGGIVNSIDLNLGYYHPIWAWDKSNISLGINGELGYTMGNGSYDINNQYTVYQLVGQTQQPLITENTRSIKSTSFRAGTGLQMNIHFGKLILSSIMNAGYLSTTQKAFSVDETIYPQGGQATYRLLDQKETKTSGLGILPKLRFTYMLSPNIGIWLEGNYTIGPKINTETTRFVIDPSIPLDNINEGNFQEGQYITTKNETSFSAVGVNGGISLIIGKHTCLICGKKHRGKCKYGIIDENTSTEELTRPRGKHTCLICGRRHRGICKYGYSDETSLSELLTTFRTVGGDSKLYDSEINENDCNPTKGIACTDDISVSDDFDYENFDKFVATNDSQRIKDIFIKNDMTKFLPGLMELPNSNKVIEALKSGNLTLKKIPTLKYSYQLGTPNNIANDSNQVVKVKLSDAKGRKHDYVGHVTLLR